MKDEVLPWPGNRTNAGTLRPRPSTLSSKLSLQPAVIVMFMWLIRSTTGTLSVSAKRPTSLSPNPHDQLVKSNSAGAETYKKPASRLFSWLPSYGSGNTARSLAKFAYCLWI